MPKRKRQTKISPRKSKNITTSNATEDDIDAPMPNPPASLINLLQKDENVLEYFTSLQRNLNLDVQRWKDRAMDYRSKYKQLLEEQDRDGGQGEKVCVADSAKASKRKSKTNGKTSNNGEITKRKSINGKNSRKFPIPLESVEVPTRPVHAGSEDESHSKSQQYPSAKVNEGKHDEESSLSDNSSLLKSSTGRKHKTKPRKEQNADEKKSNTNTDKEDGIPITDEDFFAELPCDDAESISNADDNVSDHSSSSGSFRDIEAEFGIQDNGVVMETNNGAFRIVSQEENDEVRRKVLDWLVVAYDGLKLIGVHLVDVHWPEKEALATDECEKLQDNKKTLGGDMGAPIPKLGSSGKDPKYENIMDVDFDDFGDDDDSSDCDEPGGGFLTSKTFQLGDEEKALDTDARSSTLKATQVQTRPIIKRRDDKDVIQDIMSVLRSLIRKPTMDLDCQQSLKVHFQPFMSKELMPACYPIECGDHNIPPHPLVKGLQIIQRSLAILDTYAATNSVFSGHEEWEKIVAASGIYMDGETDDRWEKHESIRIGFLKRDISSTILSSLEGEIIQHWATIDRAARFEIREHANIVENDEYTSDAEALEGEDALSFIQGFNTKNRTKLFGLLERVCLASIVSSLLQHRGDIDGAASFAIKYILSTAPSPFIEDYPNYAPVMSFCVLEAILKTNLPLIENESKKDSIPWFSKFLYIVDGNVNRESQTTPKESRIQYLLRTIMDLVSNIWRQRSRGDERLRGVSRAELTAYKRLVRSEKAWLLNVHSEEKFDGTSAVLQIDRLFESMQILISKPSDTVSNAQLRTCLSVQLILLLTGNLDFTMGCINRTIKMFFAEINQDLPLQKYRYIGLVLLSCFATHIKLQQLKWEANCLSDLTTDIVRHSVKEDILLGKAIETLCHNNCLKIPNRSLNQNAICELTKVALECCILSGDGGQACKIVHSICNGGSCYTERRIIADIMTGFPTVRVINLKDREDRWKQFTTQARNSQLLTVLAVSSDLDYASEPNSAKDSFWGLYAYNGKDIEHLSFEQQVAASLPDDKCLNDYVTTHWRPGDLRTFDDKARKDDKLVRSSVSERACALSHISSWIGVKRSILERVDHVEDDHLRQMCRISGFASGPPFLSENEGISPSPVCVILEDDAMLVDQFNDKLSTLLKELPRDFHFCSIGYSRPKNAPMIHYSENVGMPTCFWYLTGYIISLEGANYLLKSLPVRGPVDSWVGMKATANWENEYGHRLGVGTAPKAKIQANELPSRKQLSEIVKFRAFTSLTPLCSQKLAWKGASSMSRDTTKWRERDTDVTYSGQQ